MKHSALWSVSKFLRLELAAASQAIKYKTYTCIGAGALNELNIQHKVQAVSTEQNCDSKLRASFFYDDDSKKEEKGGVRWRQHLTQSRGGNQGLGSAKQVPYHCTPWPAAAFYSFTIPAPLQSILLRERTATQLACEHWHRMVRWWLSSECQWHCGKSPLSAPTLALQALSINTPLLLPRMDCFFLSLSMIHYSSSRTLENSAPHSCALSCRSQSPSSYLHPIPVGHRAPPATISSTLGTKGFSQVHLSIKMATNVMKM